MNILLALIVILLVVIVIWMGVMTVLYTIQNEVMNELSDSVQKYIKTVNKVADHLTKSERFNLNTIQQARRIVNEVRKVATQPSEQPFVFIEKENPEEPRS